MKISRRRATRALGGALLLSAFGAVTGGCSKPEGGGIEPQKAEATTLAPIKIGILHSLSGTMAISETVLSRKPR